MVIFNQVLVTHGLKSLFLGIFQPNLVQVKPRNGPQTVPNYSLPAFLEVLQKWRGNVTKMESLTRFLWVKIFIFRYFWTRFGTYSADTMFSTCTKLQLPSFSRNA